MGRLADIGMSAKAEDGAMRLAGGCACGDVRYVAAGPGLYHILCQCRACQKSSGAGHAAGIVVQRAGFSVTGALGGWRMIADSGHAVTRRFCVRCGSPILTELEGHPDAVALMAAGLDDPTLFEPRAVVWTSTGPAWDHIDPALKRFAKGAPPEDLPRP